MKVLITGTSGRIGSAIANFLRNSHEVIGIDTKMGPHTDFLLDVREKEKIFECVKGVDAVIHCAALLSFHIGVRDDKELREINIQGTENLLKACQKYNVRRFVFTSTTSIYGEAMVHPQRAVWVTEELLPQPRDIYDETKIAAETLCKKSSEKGVSCICLRMSRCFPEREDLMAIYRLYRGVQVQDV